jgi:hypothetical protein
MEKYYILQDLNTNMYFKFIHYIDDENWISDILDAKMFDSITDYEYSIKNHIKTGYIKVIEVWY